jgi:hypothetical protein
MVETSVWKRWVEHFGIKPWGGDFWMLKAILDAGHKPRWLDAPPMSESRQLGRGKLFESTTKGWFERVAKKEGIRDIGGKGDWRLQLWRDERRI